MVYFAAFFCIGVSAWHFYASEGLRSLCDSQPLVAGLLVIYYYHFAF